MTSDDSPTPKKRATSPKAPTSATPSPDKETLRPRATKATTKKKSAKKAAKKATAKRARAPKAEGSASAPATASASTPAPVPAGDSESKPTSTPRTRIRRTPKPKAADGEGQKQAKPVVSEQSTASPAQPQSQPQSQPVEGDSGQRSGQRPQRRRRRQSSDSNGGEGGGGAQGESTTKDGGGQQQRGEGSGGRGGQQQNKNQHHGGEQRQDGEQRPNNRRRRRKKRGSGQGPRSREPENMGPPRDGSGLFEISPKGFGFLRIPENGYKQNPGDVFVTPELVRNHALRDGHWIEGNVQDGNRGPQLMDVLKINDKNPKKYRLLPAFEELKAINPDKRIILETTSDRFTTRIIDMIAPIGMGQRGLIVAPPRTGKTTLLQHIAEAVAEKYEDMHLMLLLVDERPEEVTELSRSLPTAQIFSSSNDNDVKNHTRVAELCIERAKRLVEAGEDVFILLDSITRLGRAFNNSGRSGGRGKGGGRGRTMSGGIDSRALEIPRRIFAAARNARGGGSLTILGTALIETGSKADDLIFQEFKGTGNMELVLNRGIAQQYIYPAVDIFKSGTRREELLLPPHQLAKIHVIRRGLAGHKPDEAIQRLLSFCERFPNNNQMLIEIPGGS